jgi:GntR family transcriptional repressor for pyruvate dehydrogenase complex
MVMKGSGGRDEAASAGEGGDFPSDSLTHRILKFFDEKGEPAGAWTVQLELKNSGTRISAPTIGRRIRQLEDDGLLELAGHRVNGRVITQMGRKALRALDEEHRLRSEGEGLLSRLRGGSEQDLVNLLAARLPLEREVARLAAERAKAKDIVRLEAALRRQKASRESSDLSAAYDIEFHRIIADIAGNPFLTNLLSLLRNHRTFSLVINEIRKQRDPDRLGLDHRKILDGIKRGNKEAAARAMEQHIHLLTKDVRRHFQIRGGGRKK